MKRKHKLIDRIEEVKVLLDNMKKKGRTFSFNSPVKYGKTCVDELVTQLMLDCTKFVKEMQTLRQLGMKLSIDYRIVWWCHFYEAYIFFKSNGHFYMRKGKLLSWKTEQRRKYFNNIHTRKGRSNDTFNYNGEEYKIMLMEAIGMVWDAEQEDWNMYYSLLVEFYKQRGHTCLPKHYLGENLTKCKWGYELNLGAWCSRIISGKVKINEERRKQLKEVKFPYRNVFIKGTSFWEQALVFYIEQWYTEDIVKNRIKLGGYQFDVFLDIGTNKISFEYDGYAWHKDKRSLEIDNEKDEYCRKNNISLYRIREYGLPATKFAKNYFLSKRCFDIKDFDRVMRQIMLDVFGVSMLEIDTVKFRAEIINRYIDNGIMNLVNLKELINFKRCHMRWPIKSKELCLWRKMCAFREAYRGIYSGFYTNEMFEELENENFPFDPYNERFERFFAHAERYYKEYGNLIMDTKYVDYYDGSPYHLGSQLNHIKQRHPNVINTYKYDKGRMLTQNQIERLESIGIEWIKKTIS